MLMNAHYPAEIITIAKVHLERPLSIEVALAHAWILPLIDLPLLRMRFFSSDCTCMRCLLSSDLVFSYKFQRLHSKMKGKLKLLSWIFSWIWFLPPLWSETLLFGLPRFRFSWAPSPPNRVEASSLSKISQLAPLVSPFQWLSDAST